MTRRIVLRSEWGAQEPTQPLIPKSRPWDRLWLHHSVTPRGGAGWMRRIQADHQGRGWRDIAYNFGVGLGMVYEGIGPDHDHLNSDRGYSGSIVVLGNFEVYEPSRKELEAIAWLVAHGLLEGWWLNELEGEPHLTGGHRDIDETACPGKYLYERIPHINQLAEGMIEELRKDKDMHLGKTNGQRYIIYTETAVPIDEKDFNFWYGQGVPVLPDGAVPGVLRTKNIGTPAA